MSNVAEFDEQKASKIMYELFSALNHVHSCGLIHRDIKPENIMFDKKGGTVKFIDFGLACQFKPGQNELAGTPYFIAPEVLVGNYGYECDIWSMGVVIYMMMTGSMPFDGDTQEELFYAIRKGSFRMPSHFSKELKDLITKCLLKDPKDRISAKQAMNHPWFQEASSTLDQLANEEDKHLIFERMVAFHGKSKLKTAALNMLVK